MKYIIYKTTNRTNSKIYIGAHKTKNIDDGYMGSGTILVRSIKKRGISNFKKEILHIFETSEEMYAKEAEIVNEEFIARKDTYNIKLGGCGGWDYVNANIDKFKTAEQRKAASIKAIKTLRLRFSNGTLKRKKHTEETKKKIGVANSKHQLGECNSQYGTCWVSNKHDRTSIRIPTEELETYMNAGWIKQRIINWKDSLCECGEFKRTQSTMCEKCRQYEPRSTAKWDLAKVEAYSVLEEFMKSDISSLTKYARSIGVSQPALTKKFNKYISGYSDIKFTRTQNIKQLITDIVKM